MKYLRTCFENICNLANLIKKSLLSILFVATGHQKNHIQNEGFWTSGAKKHVKNNHNILQTSAKFWNSFRKKLITIFYILDSFLIMFDIFDPGKWIFRFKRLTLFQRYILEACFWTPIYNFFFFPNNQFSGHFQTDLRK